MAFITSQASVEAPKSSFLTRVMRIMSAGMEAKADERRAMIKALEAKSDEELERMGLRREDISYHVFRDLYYA